MSGWIPMPAQDWLDQRADIAGEWPEVLVVMDLRFWADPIACGGRKRPSLRSLSGLWGWSRGRTERFVADSGRWADPHKTGGTTVGQQRDTGGTSAGQNRDSRPPSKAGNQDELGQVRDSRGTPVGQQRDTTETPPKGDTRVSPTPSPTPTPSPKTSLAVPAKAAPETAADRLWAFWQRLSPATGKGWPKGCKVRAAIKERSEAECADLILWLWTAPDSGKSPSPAWLRQKMTTTSAGDHGVARQQPRSLLRRGGRMGCGRQTHPAHETGTGQGLRRHRRHGRDAGPA